MGARRTLVRKPIGIVPDDKSYTVGKLIAFLLFNILLVFFSKQSELFSTVYGWSILLIGLFYIAIDKTPIRIIYLCGYVVGAELIWRSTNSGVFYEYGKYVIIFLLLLAMLKFGMLKRASFWPAFYFALLVPSIFLLPSFDRETISFFLSGPLHLAISTMFFSSVCLSQAQVKKLLIAIIAPTIGIAFLAVYSIVTATRLTFTTNSNFITSGGFGPVQVSLQLAFGAILALSYAIMERKGSLATTMVLIAVWLISQSIFTFSRSGIYHAGATLFMFFIFYMKGGKQRSRLLLFIIVVMAFMIWIAFPYLDNLTGGELALRYQNIGTTGRDILIRADIQAFLENPLFGVGPGQSFGYHVLFGQVDTSHTEYTRLLAEHGVLGLFSMLILLSLAAKRFFMNIPSSEKSFQILMTVWALLYMVDTTMRTASPGFAFGLGAAWFIFDEGRSLDGSQRSINR